MLALRDLQTAFRRAVLDGNEHASGVIISEIADGDLPASERLAVYRNNVLAQLTEGLRETFPAVCRLVDERFFSYAAHEFIAACPPDRPSLNEYGRAFPDFLADFPPCRELVYLADVARFEWLMNVAAHAPDAVPVSPECLSERPPEDAVRLGFALDPSYGYLASPFPIDRIWRANRTGGCNEAMIDLGLGGVRVEVSRQGGDVVFRALDEPTFAFRQALARGAPLGAALEQAFAADAEFAASDALAALFQEGAVVAVTQSSSTEEHAS